MIKKLKEVNMGQSISPWDFQTQPDLKSASTKRLVANSFLKKRTDTLAKNLETRQSTAIRSHRSFIRLQARIPTEVVTIQTRTSSAENIHNSLFMKLPNKFTTFPPKKAPQRAIQPTLLSHRQPPLSRDKPSLRNFKQEIQQLSKFRIHKTRSSACNLPTPQTKGSIVKTCTLKNINIYEQPSKSAEKVFAKFNRVSTQKKHILDRILSRFQ